MHSEEECEELVRCPWCKDKPVLCSDGLGNHWVQCSNSALPSPTGNTCPACPSVQSKKMTLRIPAPLWSREEAIKQWNRVEGLR